MKAKRLNSWNCLLTVAVASAIGATAQAQLSVVRQHNGTVSDERFGHALALLDDLDNDGVRDYAIGAPLGSWNQSGDGYVQLYSGSTGTQISTPAMFGDAAGDGLGQAIANLPDITNDGYDEIVVSAPGDGSIGSSYVRVYDGFSFLPLSTIYVPSGQVDASFGHSICTADMTGDGSYEIVVGAPFWDSGNGLSDGSVFVFHSTTLAILDQSIGTPNGNLGWSVSNIGDLGNGAHSIVSGMPEVSIGLSGGGFRIVKGDPLFAPSDFVTYMSGGTDSFGFAVSGLELEPQASTMGFAIGSFFSNSVTFYTVDVNSGALTVVDTVNGRPGSDHFGAVLAPAGDVNGDGVDDLAVSSPPSNSDLGYVRTLSGVDRSKLNTYYGKRSANDGHGEAICSGGDFDGDGDFELLVGAPTWESNQTASDVGRVMLVDL